MEPMRPQEKRQNKWHRFSTCVPTQWLSILILCSAGLLTGCEAFEEDIADTFIEPFNLPSPTEASSWMFSRDPEQRRLGILLISNAPFGDEPPYMEVYRKAITDNDPMVRAAAAHGLAMHGTVEDAVLLEALLSDSFRLTRWEAARGLQRIHNPQVVESLLRTIRIDTDQDTRSAAAIALGQYKQPEVVEALIHTLDDRSLDTNFAAKRSLRILTGQDFDLDSRAWIDWYVQAVDPFAEGTSYQYPVFTRDPHWYEKAIPFYTRTYEEPGQPVGLNTTDHPEDAIETSPEG